MSVAFIGRFFYQQELFSKPLLYVIMDQVFLWKPSKTYKQNLLIIIQLGIRHDNK